MPVLGLNSCFHQLSGDALIAAKRAEIAAKLAAFKKTSASSGPTASVPSPAIAAPVPNNLPAKPALPDKSDIARKIEEAKRRVAEGVAKKAAQENPYIVSTNAVVISRRFLILTYQSAAPSKKKGVAPVEVVQQGSGLKMAAHPLLLDTAPTQLSQSKKDRYKPMLPKFASIKANIRNQPSPSPVPTHTPTPTIERSGSASANPYASGGGAAGGDGTFEGATPAVKERIGRTFRFNQKGKYVALGNQMRQEAQLEVLKQKIAESAKKAGLDSEFETLERNIRVSVHEILWLHSTNACSSARHHPPLSGGTHLSFLTRITMTSACFLSLPHPISPTPTFVPKTHLLRCMSNIQFPYLHHGKRTKPLSNRSNSRARKPRNSDADVVWLICKRSRIAFVWAFCHPILPKVCCCPYFC